MEEHKYVYEFSEDPKKLLHTREIDNFATKITVDGFVTRNRYGLTDFETPKFKKGDKVVINISKSNYIKRFIDLYDKKVGIISSVTSVGVCVDFPDMALSNFFMFDEVLLLPLSYSFKPFDKVLVRNKDTEGWQARLYDQYLIGLGHGCQDNFIYQQCIPYEGNEYLLGTTRNY